jgi:predicted O-methyltransferase YrrM
MPSVLEASQVIDVLERLRVLGEEQNRAYSARVRAREAELGERLYGLERAEIGALAPQAVSTAVGRILYGLVIAARPGLVVEFGASFGSSTIYLAAALHDLDAGRLITTELIATKAQTAIGNLNSAGLYGRVELRPGDARDTLSEIDGEVDMLFLDGANDLYVETLQMLEPRLSARCVVVADLSHGDPHHVRYREYMHDADTGYVSVEVPVDAGLVISTIAVARA